jgi:HrpA-like RNA helicase
MKTVDFDEGQEKSEPVFGTVNHIHNHLQQHKRQQKPVRKDVGVLPIQSARARILDTVKDNQVTILISETGSGKTTRKIFIYSGLTFL